MYHVSQNVCIKVKNKIIITPHIVSLSSIDFNDYYSDYYAKCELQYLSQFCIFLHFECIDLNKARVIDKRIF